VSPFATPSPSVVPIEAVKPGAIPKAFADPGLWYQPSGADADLPRQFRLPLASTDGGVPVRGRIMLGWKGRLGNCMFQYFTARALHELLGFELVITGQKDMLTKMFPDAGPRRAQKRPKGFQPEGGGETQTFNRHVHLDVFGIAEDRRARDIVLNAYGHDATYFKHFLAAGRRWFNAAGLDAGGLASRLIDADDLVVHARVGDIAGTQIAELAKGRGNGLVPMPAWYWDGMIRERREAIEGAGGNATLRRIVVVTEPKGEKSAPVVSLVQNHGAVVTSQSIRQDFAAVLMADRVALSCSTFSWWAAALRRKREVHMPQLGICDPEFPIANHGDEWINFDAGIAGWSFHNALAMKERPAGLEKSY